MLTRDEARAFYDRFGARQDRQGWYEDPPLRDLVAHGAFATAAAVAELGCGTGRFAEELLEQHLPPSATYLGCDLSPAMVNLARKRLAPFGDRAAVELTDGTPRLPLGDGSVDRFVSTYVLDLLSPEDVSAVFEEALRLLVPGGLLGVVGLTRGTTAVSRLVSGAWSLVHAVAPRAVGGCRPLEVLDFADREPWHVKHRNVVVARGIPSEVVVLRKA